MVDPKTISKADMVAFHERDLAETKAHPNRHAWRCVVVRQPRGTFEIISAPTTLPRALILVGIYRGGDDARLFTREVTDAEAFTMFGGPRP